MRISFIIPGRPQGKGRPRFTTRGGHARTYTPEATLTYESWIKVTAMQALAELTSWNRNGQFRLDIRAYFTVPKSKPKTFKEMALRGEIDPTIKPDIDNIIKSICDALNGILWHDDSQVTHIVAGKQYGAEDCVQVFVHNTTSPNDRWAERR